jgi:predicted transposase YbfD/YdcC
MDNVKKNIQLYFQIEQSLKCALECHYQTSASTRYMPIPPHLSRMDTPASGNVEYLSYPMYIATAKKQTEFANEVRQVLTQAAKDVVDHTW